MNWLNRYIISIIIFCSFPPSFNCIFFSHLLINVHFPGTFLTHFHLFFFARLSSTRLTKTLNLFNSLWSPWWQELERWRGHRWRAASSRENMKMAFLNPPGLPWRYAHLTSSRELKRKILWFFTYFYFIIIISISVIEVCKGFLQKLPALSLFCACDSIV